MSHSFPFFLFLSLFSAPFIAEAADNDLEQELQNSLTQSKALVEQIKTKSTQGASVTSELTQLKALEESIKADDLLLQDRFTLRGEKAKSLGSKASARHDAMVEGFRKALTEYLTLIDSLPSGGAVSKDTIDKLKTLLDKILPVKKKPVIGVLPYRHLNYPSQLPASAPSITPAYLGGSKTVSADDTEATSEAPISNESSMS